MKRKFLFNQLIKIAVVLACLFALNTTADAQRKRGKTRTTPAKPTVATVAEPSAEVKAASEKTAIQIKNLTKFIYILGGVARGIEDIDKTIKAGKASRELENQNTQFKQDVMQSLRNLRAGLVTLEVDFRAKPELKPYLPQIQGITDLSGRAEDLALGGQFTESGKLLLLVVEKLADTLAALP